MGDLGRNDLCHCNSGKKYKRCCLRADQLEVSRRRSASLARVTHPAARAAPEPRQEGDVMLATGWASFSRPGEMSKCELSEIEYKARYDRPETDAAELRRMVARLVDEVSARSRSTP